MLTIIPILGILTFHWIADFICQTHWQATNKSKNWYALSAHVAVYSGVITFLMLMASMPIQLADTFLLVTFTTHFVTDAITSRCSSYFWQKGDVHNFFVVVGFDQLIHQATLILTLFYLRII